jgi:hypothetical protein
MKKDITLYEAVINRALNILSENDFASVNGRIEITRDGALKILSSLPISYELQTIEQSMDTDKAIVRVKLSIEFHKTGITRTTEGIGICEKWELEKNKSYSLHNLITKAETRAIKRAIESALGGVINAVILQLFGSYERR